MLLPHHLKNFQLISKMASKFRTIRDRLFLFARTFVASLDRPPLAFPSELQPLMFHKFSRLLNLTQLTRTLWDFNLIFWKLIYSVANTSIQRCSIYIFDSSRFLNTYKGHWRIHTKYQRKLPERYKWHQKMMMMTRTFLETHQQNCERLADFGTESSSVCDRPECGWGRGGSGRQRRTLMDAHRKGKYTKES